MTAAFWDQATETADGCWRWTGRRDGAGYGMFWDGSRVQRSHRYAFTEMRAEIPDGLQLDHLCMNRACVNPDHLDPVPQVVNILRGNGWGALNARKTHCPAGHAYDEANTYVDTTGRRRCRPCRNARRRKS